ncbi:N-acetyltransferase [Halobacteriales archaeon QH_2_65_14]|nr:MAG: N-acetyltransferase [Halobacteriales archaeon QH_2_65_14]
MPGPTFISGDRIDLRPPEEEDIEFLQEGVNHPKVRQYISMFRRPYTEERYRDELWPVDSGEDGVTLLAVPTDGEFADDPVGSVQLYPVQDADGYANFGVWFHPDAWGHGFALEASAHLIEHGFRSLRLHRVSATTMGPNDAAGRLCERLGFIHEGTAREAQFADGDYVDLDRWGLLADEWDSPEAVLDG